MAEVVVKGLDDLLASMGALPLALQKTIIASSLRTAAQVIKDEAQDRAPDDPETPGSRIEVSMKVQVSDQTATGAVARIGPSGAGFVGIFSEVGTANQPATPWLGPAFEATQQLALKILGHELGQQIESEFGKKRSSGPSVGPGSTPSPGSAPSAPLPSSAPSGLPRLRDERGRFIKRQ